MKSIWHVVRSTVRHELRQEGHVAGMPLLYQISILSCPLQYYGLDESFLLII